MDCLFCKINKNECDSLCIYEDDIVKVILDAYPDANGHTLIIPKKHITDIDEMDNETLGHINNVAKKMRKLLFDALKQEIIDRNVIFEKIMNVK